jgi:hypothetical protein
MGISELIDLKGAKLTSVGGAPNAGYVSAEILFPDGRGLQNVLLEGDLDIDQAAAKLGIPLAEGGDFVRASRIAHARGLVRIERA